MYQFWHIRLEWTHLLGGEINCFPVFYLLSILLIISLVSVLPPRVAQKNPTIAFQVQWWGLFVSRRICSTRLLLGFSVGVAVLWPSQQGPVRNRGIITAFCRKLACSLLGAERCRNTRRAPKDEGMRSSSHLYEDERD